MEMFEQQFELEVFFKDVKAKIQPQMCYIGIIAL